MPNRLLSSFVSRSIACLLVLLCAVAALKAEAPTFTSPDVTEYVKNQTELMDEYVAASKEGDADAKQAASKAMDELTTKNMFGIYEKLTDAEKPKYEQWQKDETSRMAAAIKAANP
jgi:cytochrome P450